MNLILLKYFRVGLPFLAFSSSLSASISEKAWVDLPEASLLTSFIEGDSEKKYIIDSCILAYHKIAKTKVEALQERINSLGNILAQLDRLSAEYASHHKAKHLARLVEKNAGTFLS